MFRRLKPHSLLLLSYLAAIGIGTFLLVLPISSVNESLSIMDAVFTSTSAICVTGLVVVDTGTHFTLFGKLVILCLIQLGGLGIMTFSSLMFLSLGRGLPFNYGWLIQESFTYKPTGDIFSLIKSVFIFTISLELLGALVLFFKWQGELPLLEAMFFSLFHSVSAFCNAGFCLFENSLVTYQHDLIINLTIPALIILGGIGFFVVYEIFDRIKGKQKRKRFSLHSKVVFLTTLFLVFWGVLFLYGIEAQNQLLDFTSSHGLLLSFFQSVTARTAGFNTVDLNLLHNATLFFLIMLMFVGASPGSCGGGIKTTSLFLLLALIWNRLLGRATVNTFKRTVPKELVTKVISIFVLAFLFVFLITFLLLISQPQGENFCEERGFFLECLFETTSAFGTVGLTLGITQNLNFWGKLLIIITMYVGRVGLLTLAYGVARREISGPFQFAEESLMIG